MSVRRCFCPLLAALFLGCEPRQAVNQQQDTPLLGSLCAGSFWEAKSAAERVLHQQPELQYGMAIEDAIAVLGNPGKMVTSANVTDAYYKTAGGPLWLAYQDGKLIKKAVTHPPHWTGTREEMADLWDKVRDTDGWAAF